MRALLIFCLAVALSSATNGEGRAGEKYMGAVEIPNEIVSAIAQAFVIRHHDSASADKPRISFQDAEVYQQDVPEKWAVLGGYMAFAPGKDPSPHAYGLTMQLTCPRHGDLKCWQLEKLLIDKKVILNN